MPLFCSISGAENGTRTRDPNLGKVVLYQLSYFRLKKNLLAMPLADFLVGGGGLEPPNPEGADLQSAAIATMRTSHWLFQYVKTLSSR